MLDDDERDRQLGGQMRNQGGIDLDEVDPIGGEQAAQVSGELAGQRRCDLLRNRGDVGRRCRRGEGELAPKCPQTTAPPVCGRRGSPALFGGRADDDSSGQFG